MSGPVFESDFGCVTLQSCHKSNVSRWQSWASIPIKVNWLNVVWKCNFSSRDWTIVWQCNAMLILLVLDALLSPFMGDMGTRGTPHWGKITFFAHKFTWIWYFKICEFCEKWDFENAFFCKMIFKMWFLWKTRFCKCEFC